MNKSNFVHAAWAVAAQVAIGLVTGDWISGAALATGFFVGVEWMQQIYIHVRATGRRWPTPLDLNDILYGFSWDNRDRYLDVGVGLAVCVTVALIAEAL